MEQSKNTEPVLEVLSTIFIAALIVGCFAILRLTFPSIFGNQTALKEQYYTADEIDQKIEQINHRILTNDFQIACNKKGGIMGVKPKLPKGNIYLEANFISDLFSGYNVDDGASIDDYYCRKVAISTTTISDYSYEDIMK